jgi:hypothetical protein
MAWDYGQAQLSLRGADSKRHHSDLAEFVQCQELPYESYRAWHRLKGVNLTERTNQARSPARIDTDVRPDVEERILVGQSGLKHRRESRRLELQEEEGGEVCVVAVPDVKSKARTKLPRVDTFGCRFVSQDDPL